MRAQRRRRRLCGILFVVASAFACGEAANDGGSSPSPKTTDKPPNPIPGLVVSGGGGTVRHGTVTARIVIGAPSAIGATGSSQTRARLGASHNLGGIR